MTPFRQGLSMITKIELYDHEENQLFFFTTIYRRRLSYHQALLWKHLHVQDDAFIIYNVSKLVLQRPSHDKVSQKHRANRQGNTSRRSAMPTELLLCNFIEIKHCCECSPTNSPDTFKTLPKHNTSEELLPMHLKHDHRKYGKPTPYVTEARRSF